MSDFSIAFVIALGVFVLARVLAGMNNTLGRIMRWWWNSSFKIASCIPFCGWMAHFIIGEEKKKYVEQGKKTDEIAADYVKKKAEQERAEEAARQERLRLEAEAHREKQDALRAEAFKKLGRDDINITLSDDGERVTVGNGEPMSVDEFERKMRGL